MSLQKYITLLLSILMCFCCQTILAQEENEFSQLDTIAFMESLRGKSHKELFDDYFSNYLLDSVKTSLLIKHIKTQFSELSDKSKVAESQFLISLLKDKKGNIEKVLRLADKDIKTAKLIEGTDSLFNGYLTKEAHLYDIGRSESLENFFLVPEIAEKTNNLKKQVAISTNIIPVKIQANDNLEAIKLYHENLKQIEKFEDKTLKQQEKLYAYLGLAKAYLNIENYTEASRYCNKGLKVSEEAKTFKFKAYFYAIRGEIALNQGDAKKAQKNFLKSKELIEKIGGDKNLNIFFKLYFGRTYFIEKKYEEAIFELLEGERLIETNNVTFLGIQELYYYLAKSYKELGNIKESLKYYEKASEIDVQNDKKRTTIHSTINKKYDLAKLKAELDATQEKSKEKSRWLYLSIVSIVLLTISFFAIYYYKQKQNKKNFEKLIVNTKPNTEVTTPKPKETEKNYISETIAKEVLAKLEKFEVKKQFLKTDITITNVASMMKINPTYLSKTVNKYKGKSFSNYIKDLRIQYVIQRLKEDKVFRSYTVEAIAKEIGYRKAESFSKAFKSRTGLYPSYFIKRLHDQEKES